MLHRVNPFLRFLPLGCYGLSVFFCLLAAVWTSRQPPENELIVILDRSRSITEVPGNQHPPRWLEQFSHTADQTRVLVMAGQTQLLSDGRENLRRNPIATAGNIINSQESDYAQALRFAASLPRQGRTRRRILLVGDGRETRGDATRVAREISPQVRVETVAIGNKPTRDARILNLQSPNTTAAGQDFQIRLLASSTLPEPLTITITSTNPASTAEPLAQKTVVLTPAAQYISFTIRLPKRGQQNITAQVRLPGDTIPENDTATTSILVSGSKRVLWVSEAATTPLPFSLPGLKIKLCLPNNLRAESLNTDATIVLDNVPAESLPLGTVRSLDGLVRRGLGLVIFGGDHSLGLGDYAQAQGTDEALAELLPVTLIPQNSLALVLAVDVSGSMGEALSNANNTEATTKISLAASAVRAAWQRLTAGDRAGVVAFSREARTLMPLTRITKAQTSVAVLQEKLRALRAGGGTSIFAGINKSLAMIRGQRARGRQIIIVTDGSTVEKNVARTPLLDKLATTLKKEAVSLTVIVVGTDADQQLLRELKKCGANIIPAAERVLLLPAILSENIQRDYRRKNGVVGAVTPHATTRGFSPQTLPPLANFIAVGSGQDKRGAVVLLESIKGEVLAATWRLGLGRVVVTAGAPWREWAWSSKGVAKKFTRKILTYTTHSQTSASVEARIEGGRLLVSYQEEEASSQAGQGSGNQQGAPLRARIVLLSVPKTLPETPPDFPLFPSTPEGWAGQTTRLKPGNYRVDILSAEGTVLAECPLLIDARKEFLHFGADGAALARIALAGGGDLVASPRQCQPWGKIPIVGGKQSPTIARPLAILGAIFFLCGLLLRVWR